MSRVRRFPDFRLLMSVALGGIALLGAQQVGIALLGAQQVALQPGARVVSPSDARAVDSGYQPIVSPTTRLPAGSDYAPNEVIVKFVGRAAQRTAAQWMASGLGVSSVERPRFANFDVLSLEPGTDPVVVARTLSERTTSNTHNRRISDIHSSFPTTLFSLSSGTCRPSTCSAPGTSTRGRATR